MTENVMKNIDVVEQDRTAAQVEAVAGGQNVCWDDFTECGV